MLSPYSYPWNVKHFWFEHFLLTKQLLLRLKTVCFVREIPFMTFRGLKLDFGDFSLGSWNRGRLVSLFGCRLSVWVWVVPPASLLPWGLAPIRRPLIAGSHQRSILGLSTQASGASLDSPYWKLLHSNDLFPSEVDDCFLFYWEFLLEWWNRIHPRWELSRRWAIKP